MTISSNTRQAGPFTGNGTASTFAFTFKVFSAADLVVIKTTTATGTDSTLTITTDYTVSLNENQNTSPGGSVTLTAGALASGYKLTITSDIDNQQPVDLTNQGGFYPSVINDALDRVTIQVQQVDNAVERSVKFPISDGSSGDILLPAIDARKGTVLAFNEVTGLPEAGPDIASVTTVAGNTAAINTVAGEIDPTNNISTLAGIAGNITTVAGISSNVTTVAGIAANVTAVAADATDIGTVASNIASVNTVATNIADVITVANDLNEAISEIETTANDLNEAVSEIDTVATNIADVNTVGTNIASVNTVAGISANVTTVAGVSANVTTVAGISSAVSTVAADGTDIGTVAGLSTDIQALADIEDGTSATNAITGVAAIAANVTSVAGNASNINAVAGNATNINAVASNASNINAVAADATDIGTVASNIANVNTVAGDIAQIITTANDLNEAVSEIDTVATNIAAVDTVGTDIANVNTVASNIASVNTAATNVADITNFSDVYIGGSATAPLTRSDSSALQVGDLYFDTTTDTMKVYSSGGWTAAGSSVNGTANRYDYVVGTASGSYDGSSNTTFPATYDAGYVDVWLNGAKLVPTTDFTATSGTQIVLTSAASAGANVCIVGYGTFSLSTAVPRDSTTGAADIPTGTTAQRPATAATGMFRFNSSLASFEGYNGTSWGSVGGGATGSGGEQIVYLNETQADNSYTLPSGYNGGTFGPLTLATGVSITIPTGSTYTVV